jgi:predicted nucleic acid-binding protein
MSILTFIDSCVLINAVQGVGEANRKALEILDDEDRKFIVSDFVLLEVIPKPTFNKIQDQVSFYQSFFNDVSTSIEISTAITTLAIQLSSEYDVAPMDSLIVSSAIVGRADELITMEKPTNPMHRVKEIKVISLYTPTS